MTRNDAWKAELWNELNALSIDDRFIRIGEMIADITHNVLPDLGEARREALVQMVDGEGRNAVNVAASLGMRRSAVAKLLDEGRKVRRMGAAADEAA